VLYYVVLAIFLFATAPSTASSIRRSAGAEGDPRQRAAPVSLDTRPTATKLLAFVLSAALAGLAGATKAMVLQFATLTDVSAATWARSC